MAGSICGAWLESNEGCAGNGSCSPHRSEESCQRIQAYNKRHPRREDHGVSFCYHYNFILTWGKLMILVNVISSIRCQWKLYIICLMNEGCKLKCESCLCWSTTQSMKMFWGLEVKYHMSSSVLDGCESRVVKFTLKLMFTLLLDGNFPVH